MDEVILIHTEDLVVVMNNFNSKLHDQILTGVHHFIRFNNIEASSSSYSITACFNQNSLSFNIDNLTVLNLRALTELILSQPEEKLKIFNISKETVQFCQSLKVDLLKDENNTTQELEKKLKTRNILEILKFINGEGNVIKDDVSLTLNDLVDCF